ncbi:hypothetical protein LTR10_016177 [Elasticomyces elasticus]|nr:hypothetical protein LTR10_016177 [Elasticomyces elasticus]
MLDYLREGDEPVEFKGKCQDLATSFRSSLTDCLIYADYTQPHEFLIEALIFHLYGEYVTTRDARSHVWVLLGIIVRMAMRLGYHHSPQPPVTMSPFKAEMRRRAWAQIRTADILISFQVGLPSMISPQLLEYPLPRNIHDDEGFGGNCVTLPEALPDSEPTQISYLIAKSKLAFCFARALEEVNQSTVVPWKRILEIDRELRQVYDNVPNHYKLGQLSNQGSLVLISARFVLASIHHKSLCVVHSRFLEIAKSDYRYVYSRRACLSSAMTILRFQAIQNQQIPVDGRLRSLTNYQTSLAIHDYLLAATIISADLSSSGSDSYRISANRRECQGVPTRSEMIKALTISARIFGQMGDQSMEAFKAADVLGMLVKKFEGGEHNTGPSPKHASRPPVLSSPWSKRSDLPTNVTPARRQVSPRIIPSSGERMSTVDIDLGMNVDGSDTRYTPHRSRGDPRGFRGAQTEGIHQSRPLPQEVNLDFLSTWPEVQEGESGFLSNQNSTIFPDLDPSMSWAMPEYTKTSDVNSSQSEVLNSASAYSAPVDAMPYSVPLALTDPMSTLWTLSSASHGDFQMT